VPCTDPIGASRETTGADERERDLDVAARGVRVRAHVVCGVGELLAALGRHVGRVDVELDGEAEAALAVRADADARADGRVLGVDLELAGDRVHRAEEARGVAGGEELLGVGALAGPAHLLGGTRLEVQGVVLAADVAVAAPAGGVGDGGVSDLQSHGSNSRPLIWTVAEHRRDVA
jgi:hypothetical protein